MAVLVCAHPACRDVVIRSNGIRIGNTNNIRSKTGLTQQRWRMRQRSVQASSSGGSTLITRPGQESDGDIIR